MEWRLNIETFVPIKMILGAERKIREDRSWVRDTNRGVRGEYENIRAI